MRSTRVNQRRFSNSCESVALIVILFASFAFLFAIGCYAVYGKPRLVLFGVEAAAVTDPCTDSPVACCVTGGSCNDTATPICSCYSGWNGTDCCTPLCNAVSCNNGGYCSSPDTCTCVGPWRGPDCMIPICDVSCIHGVCVVDSQTAAHACLCDPGYYGKRCQISNQLCNITANDRDLFWAWENARAICEAKYPFKCAGCMQEATPRQESGTDEQWRLTWRPSSRQPTIDHIFTVFDKQGCWGLTYADYGWQKLGVDLREVYTQFINSDVSGGECDSPVVCEIDCGETGRCNQTQPTQCVCNRYWYGTHCEKRSFSCDPTSDPDCRPGDTSSSTSSLKYGLVDLSCIEYAFLLLFLFCSCCSFLSA